MPATKNKTGVKVEKGMQFRWSIADANPLWEVKSFIGKNTWECEVVNETWTHNGKTYDSEFKGRKQPFNANDIGRAVAMERMFDGYKDKADQFYASLKAGQIVHYSNGFGAFVRCEVVMKDGQAVLLPKALVGEWKSYDLYRRYRNGRVELGIAAKQIEEGETMRPHASNIFEHQFGSPRDIDPRRLEPVSYQAPPMTAEEEQLAKHWQVLEGLQEMLNEAKDPIETLKLAKDWLGAWKP